MIRPFAAAKLFVAVSGLVFVVCCVSGGQASAAENVGGIWRTGWVDMMLSQGTDGTVQGAFGPGGSGSLAGRLVETSGGGELAARWNAELSQKKCSQPLDGHAYWGEVVIMFSGDRLKGSWNACGGGDLAFEGRRLSVLPLDAAMGPKPKLADASVGQVAAESPSAEPPSTEPPAASKPQTTTEPQAAAEPAQSAADKPAAAKAEAPASTATSPATAPANGQRTTPPPPPFRGGASAYLEQRMPLRGEFAVPMSRSDNPRTWSVVDDSEYPAYQPKDPQTGMETLTWKYTAFMEGTADPEGEALYETYISIARADEAEALHQEFTRRRAELEAQFSEWKSNGEEADGLTGELSGIKRIDDFAFGQGGYILVRADRKGMHEIRFHDQGLLVTVRCSPWWGGMDYCPFVGAAVDRKIRKARDAGQ